MITIGYIVLVMAAVLLVFLRFEIVIDENRANRDAEIIANSLISCPKLLMSVQGTHLKGYLNYTEIKDENIKKNIESCVKSDYKFNAFIKAKDIDKSYLGCSYGSKVLSSFSLPITVYDGEQHQGTIKVEICEAST
jgi:hypothetical protein